MSRGLLFFEYLEGEKKIRGRYLIGWETNFTLYVTANAARSSANRKLQNYATQMDKYMSHQVSNVPRKS